MPSKRLHLKLKNKDVENITTSDVTLIKRNILYVRTSVHSKLPNSVSESHDFLE